MIHEVDEALRDLVRGELGNPDVEVVFDAPTRDWAARRNAPTVNLYLYDIREDMKRSSRGRTNVYGEEGTVVATTLPPRYFKLSYLISAWTQRPEDEHRLLSTLLRCFLRHEALPGGQALGAELAATGLPVPMSIALPPPEDRAFADVWTALGGELKPSLDLVVSAPVSAAPRYEAGPPVEEGLDLRLGDAAAAAPPGDRDGADTAGPDAGAGGPGPDGADGANGGPARRRHRR